MRSSQAAPVVLGHRHTISPPIWNTFGTHGEMRKNQRNQRQINCITRSSLHNA